MNHPIPAPRRPMDTRSTPVAGTVRPTSGTGSAPAHPAGVTHVPAQRRPEPSTGPSCLSCTHRTCRTQRARTLPRLGGHRSEFSREHAQAAQIQARHPHLLVYFGEATQSFWIATPTGLIEAQDVDELLLKLWPHTDRPALRPWAQNLGGTRALAMA